MKILDSVLQGKIVKESYGEGSTVAGLAQKYGVSTSTIHRWRQNNRSAEQMEVKKAEDKFVKVTIKESATITKLRKAELVYENCRLAIDGEISSDKLFSLIQTMEGK